MTSAATSLEGVSRADTDEDPYGVDVLCPRAIISVSALRRNHAILLAQGRAGALDLRADAWGHGAEFVAANVPADAASQNLIDNNLLFGLVDGFEPVMTLQGTVLSVKTLLAGEGVSYGYTFRAEQDTTVALVTGGYAQGIVRSLGNVAEVSYGDVRFPIVGRVAMDVCVIEIGDASLPVGAHVEFFGQQQHISAWAKMTSLSTAELVTACGTRAVRRAIE